MCVWACGNPRHCAMVMGFKGLSNSSASDAGSTSPDQLYTIRIIKENNV